MYPPRVKMTVAMTNPSHFITLPVKVSGCESDGNLDMELTLPLGIIDIKCYSYNNIAMLFFVVVG